MLQLQANFLTLCSRLNNLELHSVCNSSSCRSDASILTTAN